MYSDLEREKAISLIVIRQGRHSYTEEPEIEWNADRYDADGM